MVEQGVFVAKLAKALQMLCHGYLEYNSTIEIIGHINLRIDNQKYDYIVNEQVSRQGGESTFFQSNSYHSLPPGKCCQTADRQHASRFEDDVSINSHQRVNDSLASMGGNCIKVDLSGPVPYTHGTHLMQPCLSQEACYSSASSGGGTNRRRSHSRDSRLRSVEEDQASAAAHMQDHKFNHSNSSSKDREIEMNGNGDSSRTDAANVMAMYKDMERLRQQRQDMSVKAEPGERTDSEMDDPIAGVDSLMRDNDVMETTTVSILPTAHQAALAAHTGHALMSTNAMAHHGFFDGSGLAAQDASVVQSSAVQEAILQQILNAQKHAAQLPLPGARFGGPAGVALTGAAAATTFGAMGLGLGPVSPHYPMAFHHLAQTYMHAVWQHGLPCEQSLPSSSSASSSSSVSTTSASAAVSVRAWKTDSLHRESEEQIANNIYNSSTSIADSSSSAMPRAVGERGKRTMTPAQRMREYREKLKRNPEVYQRYKQMNALRSRLARMRRSQDQVERDREKARVRNLKYRLPGQVDLSFLALAGSGDGTVLDFSSPLSLTSPPTHLLHQPPAPLPLVLPTADGHEEEVNFPSTSHRHDEDGSLPSSAVEDWEPPVTFQQSQSSP